MQNETPKNYIGHLLSSALSNLALTPHLDNIDISIPGSQFGDYSTNTALVLAKKLKQNPKAVAALIIEEIRKIDTDKKLETVEEKAGFINFTFSQKVFLKNLENIIEQGDLYGCSIFGSGKNMVVEYFQNNVAKPPHVGHLRSAVNGDCIVRILKSQGYKTISDTHIGDWGVQFGILIYAYKEFIKNGGTKEEIEKDPINELNKLYVELSSKIESNPELREMGKQEFLKLEKGDTQNRELWQWFVRVSLEDFETYRNLLHILPFDHNLGESFYEDKMPEVLEELKAKGLVKTGETGEQYVDLEDYGLGRCILVKSDGGTTYHLRDFATYIYRKNQFHFEKNIYVVDNRQSHHFNQLFKVLELAGYPTPQDSVHVDLGFMSLPEGAISTRKGTIISLKNLIEEANKRALAIIEEKNPDLINKKAVAQEVALAAIKYFDLSHNRKTEIVFTWEKALSFEGNTGPYLQYAHARIHGILRKAELLPTSSLHKEEESLQLQSAVTPSLLKRGQGEFHTYEISLLRKLSKFPEVVSKAAEDFLPNMLCNYLFELSQTFNAFYQEVPVLQEPDEQVKNFRLNLITATAQVIKNGLYLLGIEAPEEM
jgi:arginyl-tRNA synthetase